MPNWQIIGKSARLKKGDLTPDGRKVEFIDTDGQVYVNESIGQPLFDAVTKMCEARVFKVVDQGGTTRKWRLKGDDVNADFPTLKAVVAFVTKIVADTMKATLAEQEAARQMLEDEKDGQEAGDLTFDHDGVDEANRHGVSPAEMMNNEPLTNFPQADRSGGLRGAALDGATDPFGNRRRKSGGMLDGKRLYEKTAQEKAARRARLL